MSFVQIDFEFFEPILNHSKMIYLLSTCDSSRKTLLHYIAQIAAINTVDGTKKINFFIKNSPDAVSIKDATEKTALDIYKEFLKEKSSDANIIKLLTPSVSSSIKKEQILKETGSTKSFLPTQTNKNCLKNPFQAIKNKFYTYRWGLAAAIGAVSAFVAYKKFIRPFSFSSLFSR